MRLDLNLKHWKVKTDWDGTVTLVMDKQDSSANALSRELRSELSRVLEKLSSLDIPGLIIYSAKSTGFSVGADVTEFTELDQVLPNIQEGQQLFELLHNCTFPIVAAIHGHCLGGGCEMALACTYRVAADTALIGLPEVRLGIHPGWGGTARLPDLIGSHNALPIMLQGKPVKAKAALKLGLVDSVCTEAELLTTAREALYNANPKSLLQQALVWTSNSWPIRQIFSEFLNWQTRSKVQENQYPAPFKIIQLWREYGTFEERLANEAASIYSLAHTSTAESLIKIFLLQESLKKGDKGSHGFKHIHIIGSTVLAGDLAALCATKGFKVTARDNVAAQANKFFDRKQSNQAVRDRLVIDPEGLLSADAIIEALPEDFNLKRTLFEEIEGKVKHGAIIITTTGVFSLESLSAGLNDDLSGIHFFDPVGLVPLVEVPHTYEASRIVSFAKALGKLPVVVKSRPGLLINRILTPYIFEALYMLEEGISATAIDRAAKNFGMPIGPLEYIDTIGLDTWATCAQGTGPLLNLPIPKTLINPSFRGKADGKGIYTWIEGKAVKEPSSDKVSIDRLIFPLVCSALTASNLKIAAGPDLIDGAIVFSTGFAPFLGGPIKYSKSREDFDQVLQDLHNKYGDRFLVKRSDYFNLMDE